MATQLEEWAGRMLADFDARTPCRLFAGAIELTPSQAYALQAQVARLREDRGERVIGYKIGCTSAAIQQQLGIDEPIFARLFDTECHDSGARLSYASYANLAVEGELALRLSRDLSSSTPSANECRDAIEAIFPVIELHHYVLRSPRPCVQELIASNGMNAGFVATKPPRGGPLVRPRTLTVQLDDAMVGETDAPWTMTDPITSVQWLAARLKESGLSLSRGQVILTGSPLPLYPVGPGSQVVVQAPPLRRCRVTVIP